MDLFEFETSMGEGDGGDPGAVEPSSDDGFSIAPEDWQRSQDFIANAVPLLEDMAGRIYGQESEYGQQFDPNYGQGQYDQYGPPYGADPYAQPDPRQIIGDMFNQMFEERFGPMQGVFDHLTSQAADQLTQQHVESLHQELGDFDNDMTVLMANGLIAHEEAEPDVAFRAAAQQAKAFEEKIRADERQKVEEQYRNLAGAAHVPPAGGAAAQPGEEIPRGSGPEKYQIAIQRTLARSHPTMPTG